MQRLLYRLRQHKRDFMLQMARNFFSRAFSIAVVQLDEHVLNARIISIALGCCIVLAGAKFLIACFISITLGGRIVPVRAPRFIGIAFGGCIVLVGVPRFIRTSFGVRIVLVRAPRFIRIVFCGTWSLLARFVVMQAFP